MLKVNLSVSRGIGIRSLEIVVVLEKLQSLEHLLHQALNFLLFARQDALEGFRVPFASSGVIARHNFPEYILQSSRVDFAGLEQGLDFIAGGFDLLLPRGIVRGLELRFQLPLDLLCGFQGAEDEREFLCCFPEGLMQAFGILGRVEDLVGSLDDRDCGGDDTVHEAHSFCARHIEVDAQRIGRK